MLLIQLIPALYLCKCNVQIAFKMKIVEEISDVIQVCQEMPRVLEYFIWIVDKMYSDGFLGNESERDHDYGNNVTDENDNSMQLTEDQVLDVFSTFFRMDFENYRIFF